MDPRHERIKVLNRVPSSDHRVDSLDKMKAKIPSLQKYISQSCAEETFAEIYHWTFLYLREGGIRKVIDIEVPTTKILSADL